MHIRIAVDADDTAEFAAALRVPVLCPISFILGCMQLGYINAWLASPSVSLTLSTKHVIHVIIYAVECFSEKKRMPQLSLALFICTDPVTEEEKLNRVVVGTPESPEKKKTASQSH